MKTKNYTVLHELKTATDTSLDTKKIRKTTNAERGKYKLAKTETKQPEIQIETLDEDIIEMEIISKENAPEEEEKPNIEDTCQQLQTSCFEQ